MRFYFNLLEQIFLALSLYIETILLALCIKDIDLTEASLNLIACNRGVFMWTNSCITYEEHSFNGLK